MYNILRKGDKMAKSRTKNSIINSTASVTSQIITVLMDFVVKTIFIHVLGSTYLGINGLFSNIITLLSLADLGIGVAIPYSLYKPLADKDTKKIKSLMKYYSKIYTIIGLIVLGIGLSLTPFLPFIIKNMPTDIPNIYLIYMMFVTHSALSYLFVYKRFLIESDQKGYIVSKITLICSTLLNIVRVSLLLLTKNFIIYLACSILFVLIQNIWYSKKADELYPYLKEKDIDNIDKKDLNEINKNIKSLLIYKIGSVLSNGTDNIIISKFIGLITVGLYSNYLLITNSINNVVSQIFTAITSSVGNLIATNNEKSKAIYEKLNFFDFYIFSFCSICLFILLNPFIYLWIGSDYMLNNFVCSLIALNFYTGGMGCVTNSFRTAYGLFYIAKFRPIIMVILNIAISIILVIPFGIAGVIMGTIISRMLTTAWLDPYIVYKHGFKESPKDYYLKYIYYLIIFTISSIIIKLITGLFVIDSILTFILAGLIATIIYHLIIVLLFRKTEEFNYFYEKIKVVSKSIYKKIMKKKKAFYEMHPLK